MASIAAGRNRVTTRVAGYPVETRAGDVMVQEKTSPATTTALLRLYGAHNWDCAGVIRFISRSRCVAHQRNPQLCYLESLVAQHSRPSTADRKSTRLNYSHQITS